MARMGGFGHDPSFMEGKIVVVGVDEAGYGPLLGPLVVSATAFELPAEVADRSLWDVLDESVDPSARAVSGRIPILDSKKLFQRKDGIRRLERSVLATVAAWRGLPPTLAGLLRLVCPATVQLLQDYPWYRESDPALPLDADPGGIRIAIHRLEKDLDKQAVRIAGFWSEVLLEGHYNRLIDNTHNKAVVLLGLTLRLVQRVADAFPGAELRVFIDKQGARDHYGPALMRAFEGRRLRIVGEGHDYSAYELTTGEAPWRVRFEQSGESLHLPVALASMLSKYVRELLMTCFNEFWSRHVPDLRPTAGYYQDGQRFVRAIQSHIQRLGIDRDLLVRQR